MRYGCIENGRSRWLGSPSRIIGHVWGAYCDWRTRRVMLLLLQSSDALRFTDIGVTAGEVSSYLDSQAWLNNVPGLNVVELQVDTARHRRPW